MIYLKSQNGERKYTSRSPFSIAYKEEFSCPISGGDAEWNAPTINGENTGELSTAFLYKKRKILLPQKQNALKGRFLLF